MLYCARKAGVTHVLKAGGAQAVAAMAWGTESCPKVGNGRNQSPPVVPRVLSSGAQGAELVYHNGLREQRVPPSYTLPSCTEGFSPLNAHYCCIWHAANLCVAVNS